MLKKIFNPLLNLIQGCCMIKVQSDEEVAIIFKELLTEYCNRSLHAQSQDSDDEAELDVAPPHIDIAVENQLIIDFLNTPCNCGNHCQKLFTLSELLDARTKFRNMSTVEKNCFILSQLVCFAHSSMVASSARTLTPRKRQKFEYRINADRPVCKGVFLFYYGESIDRLKRLQKTFLTEGVKLPMHGNKGSHPVHACSILDRDTIKSFIINFSEIHGLPDPGRDVRKGKGRLRILLPSVMNYVSIHQVYQTSIIDAGNEAVGYRTFLRVWQDELSYIVFNNPKSDLCIQCEDFKKKLNQVAAILDEEKEAKQAKIYQNAIDHINHAKKERMYYRAYALLASKNYRKIQSRESSPCKANSIDTMMHYSWDFAQQFHYPFEDQQVGPIYFKTPRRAQLFGDCGEGIPKQVNYLIDEADFLAKDANTVISLLDHFFENHGLGEKSVYLTADNCTGQNKNNALIQYLMYRVLMGLHDNIELSFLVVGHTKFSPDGYFGLIRNRYRRSQVYTYDQLASTIEQSSPNGHNTCQTYCGSGQSPIIYRNWTDWLAQYFKAIPGITSYHHFKINKTNTGVIKLKKIVDSQEVELKLLKERGFPYNEHLQPINLPCRLMPEGLSAKRQWYLYDQIRMHIPNDKDKDITCPKPSVSRPLKED